MTDQTGAPAGESAAPAIEDTSELSLEEARRMIDAANEPQPAEGADDATADEPELSKDNAAPEKDPGEEPEEADPEEEKLPPIERPRSWAKDLDEEWASYPREAQEKIAKREQERDAAIRRSQNEAAEIRKAAEAARDEAAKARQEYEAKLPAIMQALQDAQAGTFSDIKTMDDVTRLASEDPFRYLQWQAHQQKLQAVNYELERATERQTQEQQTSWQKLVADENAKFIERVPEFADKAKAQELTTKAVERLSDLGFTQTELADLANGKSRLPIYDHRIQQLLVDSLKLQEIQNAPKAVAAKPLPPVQRPGVSRSGGNPDSERIQALEKQLTATGDMKIAAQILELRNAARSRRAS